MSDGYFEPTDAEKLEMRFGLSRQVGALMRAWWLGMFHARNSEEQELLDHIGEIVGPRPKGDLGKDATPLGMNVKSRLQTGEPDRGRDAEDLVPISDEEYLAVFDDLILRWVRMGRAYRQGMVMATNSDQERQLVELRELFGDELSERKNH